MGQYTTPLWGNTLDHCGTINYTTVDQYKISLLDNTLHNCVPLTRALWDNTLHCTTVVKIRDFALCMTTQTTGKFKIYILAHSGVPSVWPEATQNLQKKSSKTEFKKHKLCF